MEEVIPIPALPTDLDIIVVPDVVEIAPLTPPDIAPYGISLSTTITLGYNDPAVLVAAAPPMAIQPGSALTLQIDDSTWTSVSDIAWWKNGEVLPGETADTLSLNGVTTIDSGSYQARFTADGAKATSVLAHLVVRHATKHPLVNISTRARLSLSSPQVTLGFVIPDRASGSAALHKNILLRAIGPSLADYGVADPLPDPVATLHDAAGNDVTPALVFPAVIYEDGSSPESHYYESIRNAANAVGAFPVPVSQVGQPAADYSALTQLPPGSYTLVIESASGQSGDVLVEIYEVGL